MANPATLDELRRRVLSLAGHDPRTPISGLLLSRHQTEVPDYQLTEPLFILMVQGRKRLYVGSEVVEYGAGECLVVTTTLPLSGHFVQATAERPALAITLILQAAEIAALLPELDRADRLRDRIEPALGTQTADTSLLEPIGRLLQLIDQPDVHPGDRAVLAPLIRREILWRLMTGPSGDKIARIGLADGSLAQLNQAIGLLRDNFAEPIPIPKLARAAGMSSSTFHRHFRATTGMTPLQFQKLLQLQEARSLLLAGAGDVTRVGQSVGYHSPTQFNREYRRLFGAPPGRDTARLRSLSGS